VTTQLVYEHISVAEYEARYGIPFVGPRPMSEFERQRAMDRIEAICRKASERMARQSRGD